MNDKNTDRKLSEDGKVVNEPEFVNTNPEDFPPLEDETEGADVSACAEPRMWNSKGFIPIGRQVYECPYFVRGFTKYIHWLFDLYGEAEFKDTTKLTFHYHKPIKLKRGQYYAAYRYLANRWGVSTNKVRTFLNHMEAVGQIETQSDSDGTIITLSYYGGCKPSIKSTGTHGETHSDTQSETDTKRRRNAYETNPRRENKEQKDMNNLKNEGTADV